MDIDTDTLSKGKKKWNGNFLENKYVNRKIEKGGIWFRFNIILFQIKQLVGLNKQNNHNFYTCLLHENNTHIIVTTNIAHEQI